MIGRIVRKEVSKQLADFDKGIRDGGIVGKAWAALGEYTDRIRKVNKRIGTVKGEVEMLKSRIKKLEAVTKEREVEK